MAEMAERAESRVMRVARPKERVRRAACSPPPPQRTKPKVGTKTHFRISAISDPARLPPRKGHLARSPSKP